jgi:Uma2 family endonuclease
LTREVFAMLEMLLRSCQTVKLDPPYLLRKYGVSEEEFEQITDEDIKAELFDGELIVHSPASLRHDRLCTFLSFLICGYADRKQLGIVYGANNAVMRLASRRKFAPDLMFVGAERLSLAAGKELDGAPDLVMEVLSEATRRYDLEEKRQAYREAGIDEIWLVDDNRRQLIIDHRQKRGYREQLKRRGKSASQVLPGFWLEAAWLWETKLPEALSCLEKILG